MHLSISTGWFVIKGNADENARSNNICVARASLEMNSEELLRWIMSGLDENSESENHF